MCRYHRKADVYAYKAHGAYEQVGVHAEEFSCLAASKDRNYIDFRQPGENTSAVLEEDDGCGRQQSGVLCCHRTGGNTGKPYPFIVQVPDIQA